MDYIPTNSDYIFTITSEFYANFFYLYDVTDFYSNVFTSSYKAGLMLSLFGNVFIPPLFEDNFTGYRFLASHRTTKSSIERKPIFSWSENLKDPPILMGCYLVCYFSLLVLYKSFLL